MFIRTPIRIALLALLLLGLGSAGNCEAAPIQKIQGVIVDVGEGYLWLKPDDGSESRKFILRWKAQFIPPKLPLEGDRVLLLYKDKAEGAIVYGVKYLGSAHGTQNQ
ncbi:MAG: hypothetical protein AB1733_08290 [Thermodesulfobacteriota bacterium]